VRQLRGEAHPKVQVPNCDLALAHGTAACSAFATRLDLHSGARVMADKPKYPTPQGNPETKPFLGRRAQGKFLIKRCTACGEPHYFRARCAVLLLRQDGVGRKLGRGRRSIPSA